MSIDLDLARSGASGPFRDLLTRFRAARSPLRRFTSLLARFKATRVEAERERASLMSALANRPPTPTLNGELARRLLISFNKRHYTAREARAGSVEGMNVWRHAGLGRSEVRNVGVLAWFIDPRGDHGQGTRFYRCLVEVAPKYFPAFAPNDEPFVRTEQWADDYNRLDIELVGRMQVVVIEAKIDAPVRLDQLEGYWALTVRCSSGRAVFGVLLTPGTPTPPGAHAFEGVRWRTVILALDQFAGKGPLAAQDGHVRALAKQFSEYLDHLMET